MADTVSSFVEKAKQPFSFGLQYIGLSAVGGYVGAYAYAKYEGVSGIDPLGSYQVESLIAGGVGGYLWLIFMDQPDLFTWWKPILVGAVTAQIYDRWIRNMMVEWNILSA